MKELRIEPVLPQQRGGDEGQRIKNPRPLATVGARRRKGTAAHHAGSYAPPATSFDAAQDKNPDQVGGRGWSYVPSTIEDCYPLPVARNVMG